MGLRRIALRAAASLAAVALLVTGLTALEPSAPAEAVNGSQFQAGNIISNANFYDGNAMTQSQIQSFLNGKIGACANSNCLNVLTLATTSKAARYTPTNVLVCREYAGAPSESAAAVIFKVQQACGISAKVLLVTLQKEQSLVTHKSPTAAKLERAMGYGCPDNTGGTCDSLYYGFFNQLYSAAWQLKRYGSSPVVGNYQLGNNTIRWSPAAGCDGGGVYIQNSATAALYNYTPYQPNAAALANLGGVGDACSSYGNRNFWAYYSDWFGSTIGTAGTPEGTLDPIVAVPGQIPITGWVVDPDAVTAPVTLSLQLDSTWSVMYANQPGPSLEARYPGAGQNHSFSGSIPASQGLHTLCIYLVNAGGAGDVGTLGCQLVTVPPAPAPVGAITTATAASGRISFAGWAVQPDQPTNAVPIAVNIGSQWIAFAADQPNGDAPAAFAGAGASQGFSGSFAAPPGVQSFCIWASPSSGAGTLLGCRSTVVPPPVPSVSAIESVSAAASAIAVSGYAVWPDAPTATVSVAVNIGSSWYPLYANQPSAAGAAAVPSAGANHGYSGSFAVSPGNYSACVWVTQPAGGAVNSGCRTVAVAAATTTQSAITAISGAPLAVTIAGWAVWTSALSASVPIAVNIGSSWYPLSADRPSPAASTAVPGAGPSHGFEGSVPAAAGVHSVCIWAIQYSGGASNLGCQTVTVTAGLATVGGMSLTAAVGGVHFEGWAVNPGSPAAVVPIAANIGSQWIPLATGEVNATAPTVFSGAGPNQGFSGLVASGTGPQTVCIWASGATGAVNLGCSSVTVQSAPAVAGALTAATGGAGSIAVTGWAVWPSALTSAVPVAANVGANWTALPSSAANGTAARFVLNAGPNQGFEATVASPPGPQTVCIWASPPSGSAVLLGCQSVTVA